MAFLLIILTLLSGGYIGWAIGANDAANCVGADIGSGRMTVRQGIFITCFFSFLGAVLLGSKVVKTIGKGIVPLDRLDFHAALFIALAACFAAGTWIIIATMRGLPVSTSHAIVGAVAGAGLAVGAPVIWKKLLDIFICWVFTPVGGGVIAYLLYRPFRALFYSILPRKYINIMITFLIFATSIYLAFTWGANDVANATGVIAGAGMLKPAMATVYGAVAIVLGIITLGKKVIKTVGHDITRLYPVMTIVAELASSINVHLYTLLGIPVSTSHSIVGAIVGVGMVRGIKVLNRKIIYEMILAWGLTPFASGVAAFTFVKLFRFLANFK